jgi:glycerol-3-phosphate dehydrogenase
LEPALRITGAEVVWAVRQEMALTLDDVPCRRTRALLLDVRPAPTIAPKEAQLMAVELGKDEACQRLQLAEFIEVASGYDINNQP